MNVCPEWLCGVVMGAQSVHEMTHGGGKRREEKGGGVGRGQGGKTWEKGKRERVKRGGKSDRE